MCHAKVSRKPEGVDMFKDLFADGVHFRSITEEECSGRRRCFVFQRASNKSYRQLLVAGDRVEERRWHENGQQATTNNCRYHACTLNNRDRPHPSSATREPARNG